MLAPASLQEVLNEAADRWVAGGNPRPLLSFSGTPQLVRQVEQGAPADIVITADPQWMQWLEDAKRISKGSEVLLAGNGLSLVSGSARHNARALNEVLLQDRPWKLAMGDPDSVPAGRYGKAALTRLGLWDQVSDHVVPTDSVRAALALVERGEADFGIVYRSDAAASEKLAKAWEFPASAVPPIRYPAAMVATSSHPHANAFLSFLTSVEVQFLFRKHGFVVPVDEA